LEVWVEGGVWGAGVGAPVQTPRGWEIWEFHLPKKVPVAAVEIFFNPYQLFLLPIEFRFSSVQIIPSS
jgi:hypothetical protein